jgi:UDP:flavonoid glycosyltransferase YjiC (YdhE family)
MKQLRIDLVAPPFAGHLHPILGVARRLGRDHEVRVLSTERAQGEITAAGLAGLVVLAGCDEAIAAIADPPRPVGSNPMRLHDQLRANLALLDRFQAELRRIWATTRPDLLLADFTLPVAGSVARELGIAWWTTHPSPCVIETSDGPPAYFGGWAPGHGLLGGALGRLRDGAGRRLTRGFKRIVHRLHRRQLIALGLPSIYRSDGSEAVYSDQRILALGLAEFELPRRWPPSVQLVGPILYTPPRPSHGNRPTFRDGRRHVLVSLGTHLGPYKEAMAAAVRRAALRLPTIDFHLSDGEAGSERCESSDNFQRLGYVSYAEHLERYDLVVHHGGAGILYYTLRAGLPALVVPIDYDQPDHATRLEIAGLARRLRSLDDLPHQVDRTLADSDLRANCRRFQSLLAPGLAEDRIAALVSSVTSEGCQTP